MGLHVVRFVHKYGTASNAGRAELFQMLNAINPYFMFLGIKTQAFLVISNVPL